jgi:hypothetical protein
MTATTPGASPHGGKIEAAQAPMRDRTHADGQMQRIARLGQIVGVERFAGDVERGRIVRDR